LLKSSVAPEGTLHPPPQGVALVQVEPPLKLSVAAPAVTVPVLLKSTLMVLVLVPPVFAKVPVLLKVAVPVQQLYCTEASVARFQVPALFTTAPPHIMTVEVPLAVTVAAEGMLKVPLGSHTVLELGKEMPPLAVVVPLALSVPPDQVSRPERFKALTVPEIVPPEKFTGPATVVALV
jgi:hypothetical protein